MKRLWLLSLLLLLVLSGCGAESTNGSKENYSPKGVLGVNQMVYIDYVQHVEGNEYELGVISEDTGRLIWRNSDYDLIEGFGIYPDLEVYVKSDVEKSYLERKPDKEDGTPLLVLYISDKDSLEAGTIERNCGKACTEEIKTKMIH